MEKAIPASAGLFGRESEQGLVVDLLEHVQDRGGALVVGGAPGVGKSALLSSASAHASDTGIRVLKASGVQSEAQLAFAGLHQLLQPVLDRVDNLPTPERDAIMASLGKSDTAAPDLFRTALAALDLLAEIAATSPVLVIADDAHWLDRPTGDVLTFVARRLEYEPILLIAAIRDGFDSPLATAELPRLQLEALDPIAAAGLLDHRSPDLAYAVRQRVLDEAAGNPLALVELPIAFAHRDESTRLPAWLPLTTRLERAFAARLSGLPNATRTALLVAAVNDGALVSEVLAATSRLVEIPLTTDVMEPAIAAQLMHVDDDGLRFRHPLVRAAIYQQASISQRHAAHAALAHVLSNNAERSLWHRAASSIAPSEPVASELEAMAENAQARGAIAVAMAALERAAHLTANAGRRARSLLHAAELGFELGQSDVVRRLLDLTAQLDLSRLERARLEWLREVFFDGPAGDSMRVRALTSLAEESATGGDVELAVNLLFGAAMRCFWADQGDGEGEAVAEAARHLPLAPDDPWLLAIRAFSAPSTQRQEVLALIGRLSPAHADSPYDARLLGMAAQAVGDFATARGYLAKSAEGLRDQGRLGLLAHVLVALTWGEISLGHWDIALPIADEATQMARETAQPVWMASARIARSLIAGVRGQRDEAEIQIAEAQHGIAMSPQGLLSSLSHLAQGVTALSAGEHEDAFSHLRRLFDPKDPSYPYRARYRAISYLAEAAAHVDQREVALAALEDLEQTPPRDNGTNTRPSRVHAAALLSEDDAAAEKCFLEALAITPTSQFELARLRLAYGAWLRRQRRLTASRAPLRQARDAFDLMGTAPWGDYARQELRASGETSRHRVPEARDELSPQELQIAQLAAKGMTNREIGQMLYLSHRTISSHLYRTFPKLGITSRAQLRDVLGRGLP